MAAGTPVLLLVADISGYTRFMLDNAVATSHAREITARLLRTLVRAARPPLQVAELEGDAVFFYATAPSGIMPDVAAAVKAQVLRLFHAFEAEVERLAQMDVCDCAACSSVGRLRLKQVAHVGEATFARVGRFEKLFGLDVIVVHRLLKNSVRASRYLLLTAPAYAAFDHFYGLTAERRIEDVPDFGEVKVFVFQGPALEELPDRRLPPSWLDRIRWGLSLRLLTLRAAT